MANSYATQDSSLSRCRSETPKLWRGGIMGNLPKYCKINSRNKRKDFRFFEKDTDTEPET